MRIIMKNLALMMLIMMGMIFFYLKNQGLVGNVLLKQLIIFTVQSVCLSMIGLMVINFLWNRFVAVDG